MKTNNWSVLGILVGGLFTILSGLRYFVFWPDTDKALAYCLMGLIVVAISWLYDQQRRMSNVLLAVEDYLADKPWQVPK
jgi:uncharacterized membrane protein